MPGFTEKQHVWKQEIKEGAPEVVRSGTSKEIIISPAEQVRYKEHAKFGAMLANDLQWAVSQDQALDEMAIEARFQGLANQGLIGDQRKRLESVRDLLLRQYAITKKVGRRELLRRVESAADRLTGGLVQFRPSNVDPEDIEITPFGAIIVTIRDRAMWEDELGYSEETKGSTVRIDEQDRAKLPLREREAIERMIFLRATDDGRWQSAVRRHELFHDLYGHVFNDVMKVDYKNAEQASCFRGLRNELTAYAVSEDWQLKLSSLLNWKQKIGNKRIRERIVSLVEKEWVADGMSEDEAHARAKTFTGEIAAMEYHLCRLAMGGSEAFAPWIHALIAAESVKELVYHLSHIPSDPIDVAKIAIQPGGVPHFGKTTDLVHWASVKSLPVLHLDELVESLRRKLEIEKAKDASSRAVQNWTKLLEEILANREKMEPQASASTTAPSGG